MSASGRVAAPATWGSARTCSTCAGSRSCTTSTSSPANPLTNKPHDYLTGSLVGPRGAHPRPCKWGLGWGRDRPDAHRLFMVILPGACARLDIEIECVQSYALHVSPD